MTHSSRSLGIASAAVLLLVLSAGAHAAKGAARAAVVGVHPEAWSARYSELYRPAPRAAAGRFAVVKLMDAAAERDAYALVFVPGPLFLRKNDVVEIDTASAQAEAHPGASTVTRVVSN